MHHIIMGISDWLRRARLQADNNVFSETCRLQGRIVYHGIPGESATCGYSTGDGPACCVRRRAVKTPCGQHSVCEKMRLSLSRSPLGVQVEAGGVYNVSVVASNEVGSSMESFVRIEFGTARDMWNRPAARCTTNRLVECPSKPSAMCTYSNLSRAW